MLTWNAGGRATQASGGASASMIDHYYDKLLSVARPPPALVRNAWLEQAALDGAAPLIKVRHRLLSWFCRCDHRLFTAFHCGSPLFCRCDHRLFTAFLRLCRGSAVTITTVSHPFAAVSSAVRRRRHSLSGGGPASTQHPAPHNPRPRSGCQPCG